MFKNYIFDLYGTLIDIRTDEDTTDLWKRMAVFYGYRGAIYTPFELRRKYKEFCAKEKNLTKKLYPDRKHIDINLTNVFENLYTQKNVAPSKELCQHTANFFRCCSTEHIRLYDGAEDFLKALNEKGKKVFLLSNAQHDFTDPEIEMLGIRKYFTDIIISSDVACKKPDPCMYKILFDRHNLVKEETIMIGNDCVADIRSAFDFGIQSLYIHQEISPPITEKLKSSWAIMDGDFSKVMPLILK